MAYLTLLEAAKLMEPSRDTGIIQTYAETTQPMQVAPVIPTEGKMSYTWNLEDALAHTTTGKRNVNADFTASVGRVKPHETQMKVYGGKIQVDRYVQHHSPASVAFQEQSQIRSNAREFTIDLFEADGGTSLRGIRNYLLNETGYTGQQVNAGTTSGGDVLTTAMVDNLLSLVDVVPGRTFLYCRDVISRRLKYISKGQMSSEVHMSYTLGQFGMWDGAYAGIPIIVPRDGKGTDLLSADEIGGDAGVSTTCSLYAVTWGEEAMALVSSNATTGPGGFPSPIIVRMGDGTNYNYETLEWYVSCVPHYPRCIARVRYLKNAIS